MVPGSGEVVVAKRKTGSEAARTDKGARTTRGPGARKRASRRRVAMVGAARSSERAAPAGLRPAGPPIAPLVAGAPPAGVDAELEGAVDSLRRLLSDMIERRLETVALAVAGLRRQTARGEADPDTTVTQLDRILESLGAVRFSAEPLEIVDPLIHEVVEERDVDGIASGLVVETLRPGYRTARRRIACKAEVAVRRRP